jgi:hypothetical protein
MGTKAMYKPTVTDLAETGILVHRAVIIPASTKRSAEL